jgi:hypothetical protein
MKNDVVRHGNDVYYISAGHMSQLAFTLTQTIGGIVVYQLMFDGDAAARSSVGPVFDNATHTGIGYSFDPLTGDVTSTVDFAAGRPEHFAAVRDFLNAGLHTGISFGFDETAKAVNATVAITQYDDEMAQDAVVASLSAGTHAGISFSYNDAANSLSAAVSQIAFTGLSDVPTSYGRYRPGVHQRQQPGRCGRRSPLHGSPGQPRCFDRRPEPCGWHRNSLRRRAVRHRRFP